MTGSWFSNLPSLQGNIAFLICLLLSVSIWFSIKLSKNYTKERSLHIEYEVPPDYVLHPLPTERITIQYAASGWNLLSQSFSDFDKMNLLVKTNPINESQIISASDLHALIKSKEIFRPVTLEEIFPDQIYLTFKKQQVKTLPIIFNSNVAAVNGYILESEPIIEPDSVQVHGPSEILDTLNYWLLDKNEDLLIHDTWSERIDLKKLASISLSTPDALVTIKTEQLTQNTLLIPIAYKSAEYDLIPKYVEATFNVGLSNFNRIDSTFFSFKVDLPAVPDSNRVVPIILEDQPSQIVNLQFTPKTATYVLHARSESTLLQ